MNEHSWNEFIQHHHGSFLQSWQWGEFQQAYGRPVERIQLDDVAAQIIIYPLVLNKTYLFLPYGPVGLSPASPSTSFGESRRAENTEKFISTLKGLSKKYHAIFWRYENLAESFSGKAVHDVHPKTSWRIQLADPEIMLAHMKPKWRYNIHLAERKGVTVRVSSDPKDVDQVYDLLNNTARRQHISLHPKKYYQVMLEQLAPQNFAKLYLAEYQNKIIAANIMVQFHDTVTYLHGGTDHAYSTVMAPHLLQWSAMCDAQQAGFKYYDFFGVASSDDPNDPWAGITRFKQGFSGEAVHYAGTHELPLNKMWYTTYYGYRYCRGR